jgi:hypothetical protein
VSLIEHSERDLVIEIAIVTIFNVLQHSEEPNKQLASDIISREFLGAILTRHRGNRITTVIQFCGIVKRTSGKPAFLNLFLRKIAQRL